MSIEAVDIVVMVARVRGLPNVDLRRFMKEDILAATSLESMIERGSLVREDETPSVRKGQGLGVSLKSASVLRSDWRRGSTS